MSKYINIDDLSLVSESDRAEIENAIKEIDASWVRIESENDMIKSICDKIGDDFQVKPGDLKRLAKLYHKQNLEEEQEKLDSYAKTYTDIFKRTVNGD